MPQKYLVLSGTEVTFVTMNSFSAERAVSPLDGSELWVVLDAELVPHREASDFLRALHGAGCSPNTIRVYAGRVATDLKLVMSCVVTGATPGGMQDVCGMGKVAG